MSPAPAVHPGLEEFARLVDAHVTPHMTRLGYARIGAFVHDQRSRGNLVPERVHRLPRLLIHRVRGKGSGEEPQELAMGYEALSEPAMARLHPDDPLSAEEVWLYLDIISGALDLDVGIGMPDLMNRHATHEESVVILSPAQPLAARLEQLDSVLGRRVRSLLPD